ncbi:MAG: hypothetical protein ACOYCB_14035 [Fastidiosipilaceae bacterium]|jgi:hypothetical protein
MDQDKILHEIFKTGIGLYLLSLFISLFDNKIASFLKKISYLNFFSFLFIIVIKLWTQFIKFADTLENLANWRPW